MTVILKFFPDYGHGEGRRPRRPRRAARPRPLPSGWGHRTNPIPRQARDKPLDRLRTSPSTASRQASTGCPKAARRHAAFHSRASAVAGLGEAGANRGHPASRFSSSKRVRHVADVFFDRAIVVIVEPNGWIPRRSCQRWLELETTPGRAVEPGMVMTSEQLCSQNDRR